MARTKGGATGDDSIEDKAGSTGGRRLRLGNVFPCVTSETMTTASVLHPGGGYPTAALRVGDPRQPFLTYKGMCAKDWPLGVSAR